MSSEFRPDDSIYDRDAEGMMNGVRMVKEALEKHGVRLGNRVITSRDPGMQEAQAELKRATSPTGVTQWLLPIVFCPREDEREILWFLSELEPNAMVPTHRHRHAHFRVIVEGTIKYGDIDLGVGDWLAVPAGVDYSFQAGPTRVRFFYPHPMPVCDWDED